MQLASPWRSVPFGSLLLAAVAALTVGCPSPESSGTDRPDDNQSATGAEASAQTGDGAAAADEEGNSQSGSSSNGHQTNDRNQASNVAPYNGAYAADADSGKYPPLFQDWTKPVLTLYFTGRQHGYIEPCGCTGLANQKGGLNRRHTLYERLVERGYNPVALDIGNQVRRFGRQPEIKFQSTISGLKKIGYEAVALGPDDLRLSFDELLAASLGVDGKPAPFLSANVQILEGQPAPYLILEKGGKRIGVTAILGEEHVRGIADGELKVSPPEEALTALVPKLRDEKCDIYVLLSHASTDESRRLAQKFELFDLVVTAGSSGEPSHRFEEVEGAKSKLVQIGTKGMYVSIVGIYDDEEQPFRLQRAPLDGRYEDSKQMLAQLAAYQQQLEAVGLEGLAIAPLPHPSGSKFVGSQVCADCHTDEYEIWEKTPHAHATDSIVNPAERSDIHRHFDPECISCHVTGWNPQEYYPYESGYLSLEKSKHLTQVGCENCHGPGSDHVAAENGELDDVEKYRQQMVLTYADAKQTCLKCHDLDNSPDFHAEGAFEKYWQKVKH